jgi:Tol biopolymer transport system component
MSRLVVAGVAAASEREALSPVAWAPDGRRFVYGARDGVWVYDPHGPLERRVAAGGPVSAVAWSLSADWLAYVDRGTLSTVRPDGGRMRRIPAPGPVTRPVWAPGGDRLAFIVRETGPRRARLWLASPDGATLRPILWDTPGREIAALFWYPDAVHLFVALAAPDGETIAELWRVRIAYPDFRRLPALPPGAVEVAMAPNAEWVAAIAGDREGERLWVQRADGTGVRMLAGPAARITGLAWSPHSDKVAYGVDAGGPAVEIWAASIVGAARVRVASHPHDASHPSPGRSLVWAPDGLRLAFGTNTGVTLGRVWVARFQAR